MRAHRGDEEVVADVSECGSELDVKSDERCLLCSTCERQWTGAQRSALHKVKVKRIAALQMRIMEQGAVSVM